MLFNNGSIKKFIIHMQNMKYSLCTINQYEKELFIFYAFLSKKLLLQEPISLLDIKKQDIISYIYIYNDKSAKTRRKKISILKTFFNFYLKSENINPLFFIPQPKIGKTLPKIVSELELKKIFKEELVFDYKNDLDKRDMLILSLLFCCGIRLSELVNLKVGDININEKTMIIYHGKRNKQRIVPINDHTIDLYNKYLKICRKLLLSSKYDKRNYRYLLLNYKGEPLSERGVQLILRRVAKKNGLKNFSPHMLRHSYATALVKNGVDLRTVQQLLGHDSLRTTQIYVNLDDTFIKKQYNKFHPFRKKNNEKKI